MMKYAVGYLTILGATVGLGYWYHLTGIFEMGLGCGFCLFVLIYLAASFVDD